jgi:hypothetical protein
MCYLRNEHKLPTSPNCLKCLNAGSLKDSAAEANVLTEADAAQRPKQTVDAQRKQEIYTLTAQHSLAIPLLMILAIQPE